MNVRVFTIVALIGLVAFGTADAAKKHRKGRKDACHLKEVEHCIEKVQNLGKRKEPSVLIASNDGLNTICKTIREDLTKCLKNYVKKCGTPLHREVTDLFIDQISSSISRFCDPQNSARVEFLKHSPCIHKKVLSTNEYKTTCNNNFLATVDKIDSLTEDADKTHSTICCGYNRWEACTKKMVNKECGKEAYDNFQDFVGEAFGTVTKMACPAKLFSTRKEICKELLPKETVIAKGHFGDNALTKYVVSLFSFLFVIDQ